MAKTKKRKPTGRITRFEQIERMNRVFNLVEHDNEFIPILTSVLCEERRLYKGIDLLIEKMGSFAELYAKKSPYYEFYYFTNGSLEKEKYAHKILSILTYSLLEQDPQYFERLYALIVGTWSRSYRYFLSCDILGIDEIAHFTKLFVTDDSGTSTVSVFSVFEKTILEEDPLFSVHQHPNTPFTAFSILLGLYSAYHNRFHEPILFLRFFDTCDDLLLAPLQSEERFRKQFGREAVSDEEKKKLYRFAYAKPFDLVWKRYFDSGSSIQLDLFKKASFKAVDLIRLIQFVSYDVGYRLPSIDQYPTTQRSMLQDAEHLTFLRKADRYDLLNNGLYVHFGLLFKQILLENKRNKDYFHELLHSNDEVVHLQALNENYQKEIAALFKQQDVHLKEKRSIRLEAEKESKQSIKNVQSLLNDKTKENQQLKKKLREAEKEMDVLRDEHSFLKRWKEYHEKRDVHIEQTIPIEEVTSFLQTKRLTIVGGHVDWKGKIKHYLPNLYFADHVGGGVDERAIAKSEVVYYMTAFMNHPLYKTVRSIAKTHHLPEVYLEKQNIELSVREIFENYKLLEL